MMGALITACDDDDDKIKTFSAQVDASNSTIVAPDRYHAIVLYSTDGGTTYLEYPTIEPGQPYKAKVVFDGADFVGDTCFKLDWSGSDPAPTGSVDTEVADFVMQTNSALKVVIVDYVPYNAGAWTGEWIGTEDGACCSGDDENTLTADPADPNKITMNNFWGGHVDVYMIFDPSTNATDQTVTIPEQTTSEGGLAYGTGSYDQCRGTFVIAAEYEIDTDEDGEAEHYAWNYYFNPAE
jgi:hypothetical protein